MYGIQYKICTLAGLFEYLHDAVEDLLLALVWLCG